MPAVSASETIVPTSELAEALKQIRKLQRLLGKKTIEAEILKETVEVVRSRKWIVRSPLLPEDGQSASLWRATPSTAVGCRNGALTWQTQSAASRSPDRGVALPALVAGQRSSRID